MIVSRSTRTLVFLLPSSSFNRAVAPQSALLSANSIALRTNHHLQSFPQASLALAPFASAPPQEKLKEAEQRPHVDELPFDDRVRSDYSTELPSERPPKANVYPPSPNSEGKVSVTIDDLKGNPKKRTEKVLHDMAEQLKGLGEAMTTVEPPSPESPLKVPSSSIYTVSKEAEKLAEIARQRVIREGSAMSGEAIQEKSTETAAATGVGLGSTGIGGKIQNVAHSTVDKIQHAAHTTKLALERIKHLLSGRRTHTDGDCRYENEKAALEGLTKRGFVEAFTVRNGDESGAEPHLYLQRLDLAFSNDAVHLIEMHRFEGVSNPDDMSIILVFEATDDSHTYKGVLQDAFGMNISTNVSDFLGKINKKRSTEEAMGQ